MLIAKMAWAALLKILMRAIGAMATEEFMEWALFWAAEKIVQNTKTPHDDEWLRNFKQAYKLRKDIG